MIRSIIKCSLYTYNRISCQRSSLNRFLNALFYCREIVLRNCTTDYYLFENIWSLHISGIGKSHLYVSILSMATRLLLIFCFYIRVLANRLTEGYLWSCQLDLYFILAQQLAGNNINMLIAHTIDQCLSVLCIIHCFHGQIFQHHLSQCLCYLILFAFVLCKVSLICIRCGSIYTGILNRCILSCQRVSGSGDIQFADGTDIARMELRNLYWLAAFHHIQLIQLHFFISVYVVKQVIIFDNTRCYLHKRIFSNKRIHNGLEYKCRFCLCKVIICFINLTGLHIDTGNRSLIRAREILYNIIQKIDYTLEIHRGTHSYRYNRAFVNIHRQRSHDLCR